METKMTKWLEEVESAGCSTFAYMRGGYIDLIDEEEKFSYLREAISFSSIEEVSEEDKKIANSLIEFAREDGLEDDFRVFRIPDNNGYNEENFDIFFLYYELN